MSIDVTQDSEQVLKIRLLCYNFRMPDETIVDAPIMPRLRNQQRAFIAYYLQSFNATDAAKRAGYTRNAGANGSQVLSNPAISLVIRTKLRELQATADETLVTLTKLMRGPMVYFLDERGEIDLESEQARANYNLLKTVEKKVESRVDSDGNPIITTLTKIQTRDSDAALALMAKHHGLLNEQPQAQVNITNNTLTINSTQQIAQVLASNDISMQELIDELQRVQQELQSSSTAPTLEPSSSTIIDQPTG